MQKSPYTILYIDDEEENLLVFKRSFSDTYTIYTATSALEGLQILEENQIDVVITDQRMPGMPGIDFLESILLRWPDCIRMVLTGYADLENVMDAVNKGQIYRYITKPWDKDELKITLLRALESYELQRQSKRLTQEMLQSEKLSAIGKMACSIIHDMKNPMSAIRGFVELIQLEGEHLNKEKLLRYTSIILTEIDRFVGLSQEILDFASGNIVHLHRESVDIQLLFENIQELFEKEFAAKNIRYETCWEYTGTVYVDKEKMRRVFFNIITNAKDAIDKEGIIRMRACAYEKTIMFELSDTGKGMPEHIRRTIFEPFVTYGKARGTGLGMAITKRIIDAHEGSIECQSTLGKGTTFVINIPRALSSKISS